MSKASNLETSKNILVIGYGNTLRSDDGAGQKIAEIVANWNFKNVISLPLHQLSPELAENISQADLVIFIDVQETTNQEEEKPQIKQLKLNNNHTNFNPHHSNPWNLLALTKALYQKEPLVYWILIPANNFNFGEDFSSMTKNAINLALEEIKKILCLTIPSPS
ncbi:hydrogenase maturation protease [Crocosphaera sp. UHCC 0190]|uniref:hydrogenase maturation protease n=1 Tax=Crocosphaera sp. UHCC 0190 TaxID=3110246 RepID=UPI002B1FE023|nr:hydrogenase maturation protease [Crocosphaera sp. UHCC 0190]MEA5509974.1 hydrogenase maturation protease [Crocosphaera sp. UHCC 0190]